MWIIVRSFSAGAPHRNSMLRAAFGGRISLFAWPRGQGWGNREDAAALPSVMTIETRPRSRAVAIRLLHH
jgi:hypothetical protein